MRQWELEEAVHMTAEALPGFDQGERNWIKNRVLTHLADTPGDLADVSIPGLVEQWAELLQAREEPVLDDQLDAAFDAALRIHGELTQEVELFCRHLVHKWQAAGNGGLDTVGDIADFILFSVIALQDGTTDLSLLHNIAEYRAGRVRFALVCNGHPEPTPEENVWLHRQIFADFANPDFSPFEENRAGWNRHIAQLVEQIKARRENVSAERS